MGKKKAPRSTETLVASNAGYPYWWTILLLSLATIALAIAMLCDYNSAASTMIILVGVSLIVEGISNLSSIIQLSIRAKSANRNLDSMLTDVIDKDKDKRNFDDQRNDLNK